MLYDAVAILASSEGAALLADDATAQDFVTDAHAHGKFIAYHRDAVPLLEAAGVWARADDGYVELGARGTAAAFIERCRSLRLWAREASVDQT